MAATGGPRQDGQMVRRFGAETGLLLVDLQVGVDVLEDWGGPTGCTVLHTADALALLTADAPTLSEPRATNERRVLTGQCRSGTEHCAGSGDPASMGSLVARRAGVEPRL